MDFFVLEHIHHSPAAVYIFIITLLTSLYAIAIDNRIFDRFILSPYRVIRYNEYYRIFTCSLIHADFMHLAFNIFAFYVFAFQLERSFTGTTIFLVIYIGSQMAASLPDVFRYQNYPHFLSLGASGAISGVLFSYIMFNPGQLFLIFGVIPCPAWLFALIYIFYSYFAGQQSKDNINHFAHLYGALMGAVLTLVLKPSAWHIFTYWLQQQLG